jgi:hypothetical protein
MYKIKVEKVCKIINLGKSKGKMNIYPIGKARINISSFIVYTLCEYKWINVQ